MSDRGLSFRYVWTMIKLVYSSLSTKTRPPWEGGGVNLLTTVSYAIQKACLKTNTNAQQLISKTKTIFGCVFSPLLESCSDFR